MVAITIIICAAVAGMVAHRVGGVDAASQHVAAPHGGIGTAAVATKP